MNPNDYLGGSLIEALANFRKSMPMVDYAKVEDDEFLKLPECGIYFQSGGDGVIAAYRVYYQATEEYFQADSETKRECLDIETVDDSINLLGQPVRDVPSIRIPGRAPTSPGCEFSLKQKVMTVHYDAESRFVTYVHVRNKAGSVQGM
ncbi:hypothetical protein IMF22_23050 [Pseudomonas poae]|uniref:Uncharacterized protein n=1 Tax=Pseudomonas poae TaxID=200451 RepID=A0A7M1KDJ0_9PSED|nr:hypothetical protein [Pseudomonas poae]QOQ74333.1 hypothetical protein IMF22_23050 [Pseudomonas poae]